MVNQILISRQNVNCVREAFNSLGTLDTSEADPQSQFSFVDSLGNTWPFLMGTWNNGIVTFQLTVPTVTSKETITLNRYYNGLPFTFSPSVLTFDLLPPYRGNFDLTGAILAWDGTVYEIGTDSLEFDYSLNSHHGTAGDGVSPIQSNWFTSTSSYITAPGNSPIVLGRNLVSLDIGNYSSGTPVNNILLQLPATEELSTMLDHIAGSTWGMTIIGLLISNNNYVCTGNILNYITYDPTNDKSIQIELYIQQTEQIYVKVNGTNVATITMNDANHYWDHFSQALCISLTVSSDLTANLYFNGNEVATFNIAYATNSPSLPSTLNLMQGLTIPSGNYYIGDCMMAIADFAIFPTILTQSQIQSQCSGWGL